MHVVHDWEQLLSDAKADGLAQERIRERWLRLQATESATLVGSLLDLAEAGIAVSIWLAGDRRFDGFLVGLGADVAVLADRGDHTLVRLDAVRVVRPRPGQSPRVASGDRTAALDLRLVELLAQVADGEPSVTVGFVSGETVTGTLLTVGADVLTIRLAPGPDGLAYCSAGAVASVRFG